MPIALDPKRRSDYTLKAERDAETPTVFHLRALTLRERTAVDDCSYSLRQDGEAEVQMKHASRRYALVKRGLAGWRDFNDQDGKPVEFTKDERGWARDESLDRLDDATVAELAEAIDDLSGVPESDQD